MRSRWTPRAVSILDFVTLEVTSSTLPLTMWSACFAKSSGLIGATAASELVAVPAIAATTAAVANEKSVRWRERMGLEIFIR